MIENVKCPSCRGPMVSRKSAHGVFCGCKAYPKCTGTRNADGEAPTERRWLDKSNAERVADGLAPSERQRQNDRWRWR